MPSVHCPHCQARLTVPERYASRRLRCGDCGERIAAPFEGTPPPSKSTSNRRLVEAEDQQAPKANVGASHRLLAGKVPSLVAMTVVGVFASFPVIVAGVLWMAPRPASSRVTTTAQQSLDEIVVDSGPPAKPIKPASETPPAVIAIPPVPEKPDAAAPLESHIHVPARGIADVLQSVCVVHTETGIGTGFVVKERHLIATNFHVVDGAKKVCVEFPNGGTIDVGGFLIASPGYDLAVLQLVSDAPAPPLNLRANKSEIGVDVFAVGNPKGLAGSVSKGIISARRRWEDMRPLLRDHLHDFGYELDGSWVQTDAAINGGNSGGPLCLADGTVVAINTLSVPAEVGQNLNFAIDATHLVHFLDRLPVRSLPLASLPPSPTGRRAGGVQPNTPKESRIPSEDETRVHGVAVVEKYMKLLCAKYKAGIFSEKNSPRFAFLSRQFLADHSIEPSDFVLNEHCSHEYSIVAVKENRVFVLGVNTEGGFANTMCFDLVVEDGGYFILPHEVLRKGEGGRESNYLTVAVAIKQERTR